MATRAAGTAGVAIAASVWVAVGAVLVKVGVDACTVGAALDLLTVAAGFATVAATSATAAEVDAFVALAVAECVEFDLSLAGFDGSAGSDVSPEAGGSSDLGCVSTTLVSFGDVSDSVVPVWAPPLLLTVTPDPTSVLEDVVPEAFVVSVAVDSAPAVEVADDLLDAVLSELVDELVDELVAEDSPDVPVAPVVSAAAIP